MGKRKGSSGTQFWDGLQGWRQVSVGDDLLLGADEYGFCGLEELDASALGARRRRSPPPLAASRLLAPLRRRRLRMPCPGLAWHPCYCHCMADDVINLRKRSQATL